MSSPLLAGRQISNLASNVGRRSLSNRPRLSAAAEVKRLGVVGAGQMASSQGQEVMYSITSIGSFEEIRV